MWLLLFLSPSLPYSLFLSPFPTLQRHRTFAAKRRNDRNFRRRQKPVHVDRIGERGRYPQHARSRDSLETWIIIPMKFMSLHARKHSQNQFHPAHTGRARLFWGQLNIQHGRFLFFHCQPRKTSATQRIPTLAAATGFSAQLSLNGIQGRLGISKLLESPRLVLLPQSKIEIFDL